MRLSSIIAIVGAVFLAPLTAISAVEFTEGSTWKLSGTSSELRWVEIHNIEGAGTEAVYHVSVLRRLKTDPVWNSKHVVAHMAITEAALSRSLSPVPSHLGFTYPETYEEGYRQWIGLRETGHAPICATTVMECAHLSESP